MKACWPPPRANLNTPRLLDGGTGRCRPAADARLTSPAAKAIPLILIVAAVCAAGCSGRVKRQWRYRSLDETLRLALPEDLATSDADERRGAVARLAEGKDVAREDVFHVLDAVARTDPVAQTRCIAIRGLARYYDARPVGTLLTILRATEASQNALPAGEDVRWEAVRALLALERKGALSGEPRGIARDVCIRLAEVDPSRNVRVVAIEALGTFQDRRVFQPLIRGLRDEDFAIAERAENSLIALTGVTHAYDADTWETWLANVENPFEKAGQTPQTTRPAGPTWWDKQKRAWRRGLKLPNTD